MRDPIADWLLRDPPALEESVVRMPARVMDGACFEVSGSAPITFDLTATEYLSPRCLDGIVRAARRGFLILRMPPLGQPCQFLRRALTSHLRCFGNDWTVSL